MKLNVYKSLIASLIIGTSVLVASQADAQVFPTASVLFSNHDISDFTINSSEEYADLESTIAILSAKLYEAYESHPNLQYTASYNNDEIIGFIVTGADNAKEANEISYLLMQLEVLGEVASTVDYKYLPVAAANTRITKKEASR